MAETYSNKAGNIQDQGARSVVEEAPASVGEKVQGVIGDLGQRVQDTASNLAHGARQAASTVESKADGAISSVGEGMSNLAETVRNKVPQDGTLGSAVGVVANQLDAAGSYLQEHGLGDMGKDLTALVRKYPVPALLVALGVGLVLARSRR